MKTEHDLKVAIEMRRASREARLAAKEERLATKAAQETEGCVQEAMRRLIERGWTAPKQVVS